MYYSPLSLQMPNATTKRNVLIMSKQIDEYVKQSNYEVKDYEKNNKL